MAWIGPSCHIVRIALGLSLILNCSMLLLSVELQIIIINNHLVDCSRFCFVYNLVSQIGSS